MAYVNIGGQLNLSQETASVDRRYGPYNSIDEAWEFINDESLAAIGLTVGVLTNNGIVEYWFKDGTDFENLVIKNTSELPSGGSEGQVLKKTATGTEWGDEKTELPSGGSVNNFLKKTETGTEWSAVDALPDKTGKANKVLRVNADATAAEWTDETEELPKNGAVGDVLKVTESGIAWGTVREVPTTGDVGNVLKKTESGYEFAAEKSELPSITGNADKILKVNANATAVEWVDESKELPSEGTENQILRKTADGCEWSDEAVGPDNYIKSLAVDEVDPNTLKWVDSDDTDHTYTPTSAGPENYLKSVTKNENIITITDNNDSNVSFAAGPNSYLKSVEVDETEGKVTIVNNEDAEVTFDAPTTYLATIEKKAISGTPASEVTITSNEDSDVTFITSPIKSISVDSSDPNKLKWSDVDDTEYTYTPQIDSIPQYVKGVAGHQTSIDNTYVGKTTFDVVTTDEAGEKTTTTHTLLSTYSVNEQIPNEAGELKLTGVNIKLTDSENSEFVTNAIQALQNAETNIPMLVEDATTAPNSVLIGAGVDTETGLHKITTLSLPETDALGKVLTITSGEGDEPVLNWEANPKGTVTSVSVQPQEGSGLISMNGPIETAGIITLGIDRDNYHLLTTHELAELQEDIDSIKDNIQDLRENLNNAGTVTDISINSATDALAIKMLDDQDKDIDNITKTGKITLSLNDSYVIPKAAATDPEDTQLENTLNSSLIYCDVWRCADVQGTPARDSYRHATTIIRCDKNTYDKWNDDNKLDPDIIYIQDVVTDNVDIVTPPTIAWKITDNTTDYSTITWAAVSEASSYNIYRNGSFIHRVDATNDGSTSYSWTGVELDAKYTVRSVKRGQTAGTERYSAYSNELILNASDFSPEVTLNNFTLSWTNSISTAYPIDHFEVEEVGTNFTATVSGDTTTYCPAADSGQRDLSKPRQYTVKTVLNCGGYTYTSKKSNTVTISLAVPEIRFLDSTDFSKICWDQLSGITNDTKINVYKDYSSSPIDTLVGTATEYTIGDTGHTSHTYKIRVAQTVESAGTYISAESNKLTRALDMPILNFTSNQDHTKITWETISGASQYAVYKCTANNSSTSVLIDYVEGNSYNTELQPGTGIGYYYFVRAIQRSGGDVSLESGIQSNGIQPEAVRVAYNTVPTNIKCYTTAEFITEITAKELYYIRGTQNVTLYFQAPDDYTFDSNERNAVKNSTGGALTEEEYNNITWTILQ